MKISTLNSFKKIKNTIIKNYIKDNISYKFYKNLQINKKLLSIYFKKFIIVSSNIIKLEIFEGIIIKSNFNKYSITFKDIKRNININFNIKSLNILHDYN